MSIVGEIYTMFDKFWAARREPYKLWTEIFLHIRGERKKPLKNKNKTKNLRPNEIIVKKHGMMKIFARWQFSRTIVQKRPDNRLELTGRGISISTAYTLKERERKKKQWVKREREREGWNAWLRTYWQIGRRSRISRVTSVRSPFIMLSRALAERAPNERNIEREIFFGIALRRYVCVCTLRKKKKKRWFDAMWIFYDCDDEESTITWIEGQTIMYIICEIDY